MKMRLLVDEHKVSWVLLSEFKNFIRNVKEEIEEYDEGFLLSHGYNTIEDIKYIIDSLYEKKLNDIT